MLKIIRTNSSNPQFRELVRQLDAYLAITDGDEHSFYDQYNKLDNINHVAIAFQDGKAIACGAIKEFDAQSMEVKRMFTLPEARGKGIAKKIISELEHWAAEMSYTRCVLETGKRQVEAVHFYKKMNYQSIENYGQYVGMENSVCFEKLL